MKSCLVNSEFLPLLTGIWDRVDPGKRLLLLDDADKAPETTLAVEAEYEGAAGAVLDPDFLFPELDDATLATTFYTTGTTGLPKGVYFSHRQLPSSIPWRCAGPSRVRAAAAATRAMSTCPSPRCSMSMHGGMPFVATMLGLKQVYPGRYLPDALLDLIQRENGHLPRHCVPTILQMLLSKAKAREVDLSGWKVIIGGAALPQSLAREALELGIDLYAGYGMSETGPVLTLSQPEPHMEDWDLDRQAEIRSKTGRAVPLVQLRIHDEAMNERAPGR